MLKLDLALRIEVGDLGNCILVFERANVLHGDNTDWETVPKYGTGEEREFINITTQSVASPRTPHLSMITIVTFTFEL